MLYESPSSSKFTGSLGDMKLALLYSSSSAQQDGRESIKDILRRYHRPPKSESSDGFLVDYEQNGTSYVYVDADGEHIGAWVSGTPFGPINCNDSMQRSIGYHDLSFRTNSSSSSFEGLMPPFRGMFVVGSGSFGHISSYAGGIMSRGHVSVTDSRYIAEEMINNDADDKQQIFTGASDEKAKETKIDASSGLDILPTVVKSLPYNDGVLDSKDFVLNIGSPVEYIETPECLMQTLLKEPDDACLVPEVEDLQNETQNYSKSLKSTDHLTEMHQGNSLSPEETYLSSSVDEITEKSAKTCVDFAKPNQMKQEISVVLESSRSKEDKTTRPSTKTKSSNDKLDEYLSQGDKTDPINHESKLFQRETSTKIKRKYTKQKFNNVNFGFGESKHSNQEENVNRNIERKAANDLLSDEVNYGYSVVSKFTTCKTETVCTVIPLSTDCNESEISVDEETILSSNNEVNITDRSESPSNIVNFKKIVDGPEYAVDVREIQNRKTQHQSIESFAKALDDNSGMSESELKERESMLFTKKECIQVENTKQGSSTDDKNGDYDKVYPSYNSENRKHTGNRKSDTVNQLSSDLKENDENKTAKISKCNENETRTKMKVKEKQQSKKHGLVSIVANDNKLAVNNDDNSESLFRITFETTSNPKEEKGEGRKSLFCLLLLSQDNDKPPTQIMPKEDRRKEASAIFQVSHFSNPSDMKLTTGRENGKRLFRSKSWEDELNSVKVPGQDFCYTCTDRRRNSNKNKFKFSQNDKNNEENDQDELLYEENANEETKLHEVLPKVDSLEKMKLDEVLPEVDSLESEMTQKNKDSVQQIRAFKQYTEQKTSNFPNGAKISHTGGSKKDENINESSGGRYVTQACKHLNTHSNNCNYVSQFVCDDCGMNICHEITAEEEKAKRNIEILDNFVIEYGTPASTESENVGKKNEDMKHAKIDTSHETTEYSSFCKDATEHKKHIKSATVPELRALMEGIGLTLKDAYPDGNCQFTAVVDQLRIRGDFSYTSRDLRHAAVDYLQDHPIQDDGTPLSEFLTGYERNWERYLSSMRQDGYWGDHHTIWALANVLQKKIIIYRGGVELHRTIVEPDRAESREPVDEMHRTIVEPDRAESREPVDEMHRTIVEPDRAESREPVDESNVEHVKAKISGSKDLEIKPDVEEIYLGHISESHYVSLRPGNWQETLLSNFSGSASDWDKLPNFSSADTSFFINYIRRGKFINEFEGRTLPSITKYQMTEVTGDKFNGLKYTFVATNKYGHMLSKEKTDKMNFIVTPYDTVVVPENPFHGSAKDLIPVSEGYRPGHMILVPVTPHIWYPMIEAVGVHICLKHLTVSKPKTNKHIAFKSAWPFEAEEWKTRERKHGWPRQETIDDVIEEGVRVVPTSSQFVNQSNIKYDTIWEYSFDIAEQMLCKMDLSREMKMLYCIWRKLLKFAFHGKKMISRKHVKTIFLYVCEGSSLDEINHEPEKCLLYGLSKLEDFLKCKHLPDYFWRKRNLLGEIENSEIYWHVKMLCILKRNMMIFLYFALDKYDVLHTFDLGRVFDILNKRALLRRGVSAPSFIYLQQICATNIRCWVSTKEFNMARILIDTWAAELSQIIRNGQVSRENLVYDVLDGLLEEDRWLFALYLDSKEGTNTLEEAVGDNECFGLKVLFGYESQEILTRETAVPYKEILVPTHVLDGNTTLFAYRFGEVLLHNIGNQAAYQYAIHYFVKHHTHDLLLSIENDKKDGNGHSSRMTILTLRGMFGDLYRSYKDQNIHLFRDLMELYEEICNFCGDENEFAFLSEHWKYFGVYEKADEAAMKALSLREERVKSTRV